MAAVHPTIVAGWREWVSLPEPGVEWIKAKLDTGARSSSIHAFDVEELERDGQPWVRFSIHPWQRSQEDAVHHECPVHDRRLVRSSSGHSEERYVVLLDVSLVGRTVRAEVTLSSRDEMGFRMLVGREALRQGFLVDAHRSYLGGRPLRAVRRRNRGVATKSA
ncbi:ATP-dependent zinc protease family protein [Nocardioides sediminis]|uniref:ATP-dependent zinc protease family protein n=1 Tax=Nocardioides sediminis TaxID=433648 RepID=UPI000D303891|nr:RimK/LysX family protein [Nocardioides sediminis]